MTELQREIELSNLAKRLSAAQKAGDKRAIRRLRKQIKQLTED